ncbi:uncharacterized protein LOC115215063 [Argonauta hians]
MSLNVRSIFITGCNRGLGLEFVKQFLKLPTPPQHVFATCRNPEKAEELQSLSKEHSNLIVLKLDVNDESTIAAAKHNADKYLAESGLTILLNNAGVNFKLPFAKVTSENMMLAYKTNVIAPCLLTKELRPLLKIASDKEKPSSALSCNRAAVINMGAIIGSIATTKLGTGYYDYGTSKAALNMITKNFSVEFKRDKILSLALHPGWVSTDMGGPKATMTPAQSVGAILNLLANVKNEHNGLFLDHNGKQIPW